MRISLIYKHPRIYTLSIRVLYGKCYKQRYEIISREIPNNVEVLDVCCGNCELYTQALQGRVSYTGIDINPRFVEWGIRRSIRIIRLNIEEADLPVSDYVVMQGSLYQFIPYHKVIVDKLLSAARVKVIIAEPIRNLADCSNPLTAFAARRLVNPGTGHKMLRFNERTFRDFFMQHYSTLVEKFIFTPGQRDLVVVLRARFGDHSQTLPLER